MKAYRLVVFEEQLDTIEFDSYIDALAAATFTANEFNQVVIYSNINNRALFKSIYGKRE